MGTPEFAVPSLRALLEAPDFEVVCVVTQPDRPAGRGQRLQVPPVKQLALAHGLPILQPHKLREAGVFEQLQAYTPDLIVVAAFGQILRQNVLDLPRCGCINVHASLLPRWRGAAPIQAAIRAGDSETGITIMQMDAGLDTGPMLRQRAISIAPNETGQTLHDKLAALGANLLIETLRDYLDGKITPQPQDDSAHTYAPMLKKEDGRINWADSAAQIARQVRAYYPYPATYTEWDGQLLKILPTDAPDSVTVRAGSAAIGKVIAYDDGIAVGTGDGLYLPQQVQLAGKAPQPTRDFLNGHRPIIGAQLS
ncbi:MAG: methionyl-tRNA formyltransferase [Aggregatilineales bacterium]